MIHEFVNLKDYYDKLNNDCTLEIYALDNREGLSLGRLRKSILLLPGGAYQHISFREGEVTALRFIGHDIPCFILHYSCAEKVKLPIPLIEVFAGIDFIRKNYEKYHIDKDKISVCGFSAGGHLAGLACANHTNSEYSELLGIELDNMKINGCILGYPVISYEYKEDLTFDTISCGNNELAKNLSIEKLVNKDFPKTFIVHTSSDDFVKVQNSLVLAKALSDNGIFLEMHIYPTGDHGMALSDNSVMSNEANNDNIYNSKWVDLAIHFVKEYV